MLQISSAVEAAAARKEKPPILRCVIRWIRGLFFGKI